MNNYLINSHAIFIKIRNFVFFKLCKYVRLEYYLLLVVAFVGGFYLFQHNFFYHEDIKGSLLFLINNFQELETHRQSDILSLVGAIFIPIVVSLVFGLTTSWLNRPNVGYQIALGKMNTGGYQLQFCTFNKGRIPVTDIRYRISFNKKDVITSADKFYNNNDESSQIFLKKILKWPEGIVYYSEKISLPQKMADGRLVITFAEKKDINNLLVDIVLYVGKKQIKDNIKIIKDKKSDNFKINHNIIYKKRIEKTVYEF